MKLLAPALRVKQASDGVVLEAVPAAAAPAPTICDWLDRWASEQPQRVFLAERGRQVTYGEAHERVARLGTLLLEHGAPRPIAILSDNSINHALVMLAAMHVGAPVVPISPAYSLSSTTWARLSHIVKLIEPAVAFVEERAPFEKALFGLKAIDSKDLALGAPAPRAKIGPDTVCKVLFTSGSTGEPRGVVNTHRMLTSNQESLRTCWPFLEQEPPVVVDWLPWSHTFGGNHNFNLVLRNGGTLFIDRGRPVPGLLNTTLENLAEVGPNLWFNVPRGFDQAVDELERQPELAARVFRNLKLIFYAAAALSAKTRERLEKVAQRAGRSEIFFTSAWGSTETSPLSTSAHFVTPTTGNLGVPVPGVQLKLARVDDRLELRVKGANVTPGYWTRGGGIEPVRLDADGFLPTGDAGRFVDEGRPEAGVLFAGRISENFKLSSGTWVSVGALRLKLVEACTPHLADAVIAGHDRESLAALLMPSPRCDRAALREALIAYNREHPGSSERIVRALILTTPLSLDAGETTDKGYTNQRRVLENRAAEVERLFRPEPDADVFVIA
jgi:feruloyl-CoA synthase